MKTVSEYTKKVRTNLWIVRALDILVLVLPLIITFFYCLANGGITTSRKVGLVGMVVIALILTLFNIIGQKHLRSPIWVAAVGFCIAMKDASVWLITICAATSMTDEFVLTPILVKYKSKLEASKVYDERTQQDAAGK